VQAQESDGFSSRKADFLTESASTRVGCFVCGIWIFWKAWIIADEITD